MSKEFLLKDYMKGKKQIDVAKSLGVTAGAIYQMGQDGRDIRIVVEEGGAVTAYEIKQVPTKRGDK